MLDTLVEIKEMPPVRKVMYVAYLIRNKESKMVYVGSTSHPGGRISAHKSNLRRGVHENRNLQNVYNACPHIDFVMYEVGTREEAFVLEKALIEHYNTLGLLLNLTLDPVNNTLTDAQLKAFREGSEEWAKSVSQKVTINGVEHSSLRTAARALSLSHSSILNRINSCKAKYKNWTFTGIEKAVADNNGAKNASLVTVEGKTYTLSEYSRVTGINYRTLQYRRRKGVSDNELHKPYNGQEMLVVK